MISALDSGGDVAETVASKKHDMFYRKNVAIKSPHEDSRHLKKRIAKAKHSRIRARDLYCKVGKPTGSNKGVAWQRTFLGPLNIVEVD